MRYLQLLRYVDSVARTGSIRGAAENMAITSTALNRQILALEEDLGTPIFERLQKGVRLNVAGEIFIQHVRHQLSDLDRIKSQIGDLSGVRRGHVSVACGQALMVNFLPNMVSQYRSRHPGVSFEVLVSGRVEAIEKIVDYSADISLIFEPEASSSVQVLLEVPQQLNALVSSSHPLADKTELRLSECAQFPMALPSKRSGIRNLLDRASVQRKIDLPVMLESDSAECLLRCLNHDNLIAFQIPVAFSVEGPGDGIKAIPVCIRDVPMGALQLSQQRGRTLSVAAARFAASVTDNLQMITGI